MRRLTMQLEVLHDQVKQMIALEAKIARNADMADMFLDGASLQAIGEKYSMTRERARQIIQALGLPARQDIKRKMRRDAAYAREREHTLNAKVMAEKGFEMQKLVISGISIARAGRMLGLTIGQTTSVSKKLGLGKLTQYGRWNKAA